MKVRKRLAALLLALGMLVPLATAVATPASAGQDYWSPTACRPDVWFYNQSGAYGTYYWTAPAGYTHVGDRRMNAYTAFGWECGRLGAPRGNFNGYYQQFERGQILWDGLAGCYRVRFTGAWYEEWGCW